MLNNMDYIESDNKKAFTTIPLKEMDPQLIKQIQNVLHYPSIENVVLMPDCHVGTGCCVGFTSLLNDKILPSVVGGDIGCGILCYPVENLLAKKKSAERIEKIIRSLIPMGNGYDKVHTTPLVTEEQYIDWFDEAQKEALQFATMFSEKFKINIKNFMPTYSLDWFKKLCEKIGSDYKYDLQCMGTLGGGNHYIEIDEDGEDNMAYISIHCGSRNLGTNVCAYHQGKIARLPENKDIMTVYHLTGQDAYEYYFDMIFAQIYGKMNRRAILSCILSNINKEYNSSKVIESVHNYIDFRDMIIRKGAVSARKGELCIVSLNMKDGVLLCCGKGNDKWNYSCAHGSGRAVTRTKAKKSFNMKKYQKEMENVYSTSVIPETIDEAPMAYKDSEFIKKALEPTVEIIKHLKSAVNLKGW